MQAYQINHHRTGAVLFAGQFTSLKHCVETAVRHGVSLAFADLRHANLVNAMLDDARLDQALLTHANLMGANLSEAQLMGANFSYSALQNACLCFANLSRARFIGTQFGATDLAGAVLDRGLFSMGSARHLAFRDVASMTTCRFIEEDGLAVGFSRPPLVIDGLDYPIILTDRHITISCYVATFSDFLRQPICPDLRLADFIERHRPFLQTTINHWQTLPQQMARRSA